VDNASNNNTLVEELSVLLDEFQGEVTRVRCFAHIFKDDKDDAVISKLQEEDDNEEVDPDVNDDNDDDKIDSAVEASDNAMIDDVIRDLEQDLFAEEMLT
jgi:hypothetical protein